MGYKHEVLKTTFTADNYDGTWTVWCTCGWKEPTELRGRVPVIWERHLEKAYTEEKLNQLKDGESFSSGAKRSSKGLPWALMPWGALREVTRRFAKGEKYGPFNWRKAIGSGDAAYVREFFNHSMDHLQEFLSWMKEGSKPASEETPSEHLAAAIWGFLALLTYWLEDPELVRKAFHE